MNQLTLRNETIYRLYILICVLMLTKALTWIYTGQGAYILDASKSQGMRIHSAFNFVLLGLLLLYNWKSLLAPALRPVMIIFFYFLLSAFWAFDFKESIRMSISILFQIVLAAAVARHVTFSLMLERLSWVAKSIVLINLLFCVLFYNLAQETGYFEGSYSGALRGIFSSKNTFGAFIAFCHGIILLEMLNKPRGHRLQNSLWLVACFGLLVMSMSVTSIGTALCTTVIATSVSARWFIRSKQNQRSLFLLVTVVLFCIGIAILEPVLNMFGRDLTFTGRTVLWAFSFEHFSQKPIFGFGLNSFWREMLLNDSLIENGLWNIGQAHNGFVDALLAGGIIGGVLVVALYFKMLGAIFAELLRTQVTIVAPALIVLFWLSLVQNLTESSFPYGIRITGTLIGLFFITLHTVKQSRTTIIQVTTETDVQQQTHPRL